MSDLKKEKLKEKLRKKVFNSQIKNISKARDFADKYVKDKKKVKEE